MHMPYTHSRILIMANMIYPDFTGGAAKVAFEQAKHLKSLGHEVTIVTLKKHRYYKSQEIIDGIIVYRYDNIANRKIFGRSITTRFNGKKFLNKLYNLGINFDVSILHYPHDGKAYFKSKYKKTPALYVFHAPSKKELKLEGLNREHSNKWFKILRKKFTNWTHDCEDTALKKAKKIAVMSHFMKTELLTQHETINKTKVKIISSGIDLEHFQPVSQEKKNQLRQELNFPKEQLVFITVRRLVKRMGIDNLLQAIKILTKKYPNIQVKIIGQGLLHKEFHNYIKQEKLNNNIELTGHLSKKNLLKYYQAADCFILPTKTLEGLGIVTLEALACGLPVLGTPAGATPEILEKINTDLIFNSTRSKHIAAGIDWFIRKGHKLNLSKKARNYVEKYHSWDKIKKRLDLLLKDAQEKKVKN